MQTTKNSIIPLSEIGDEPVGGKAKGLKLLKDIGLTVPDGFVVLLPDKDSLDDHELLLHLQRLGDEAKAIRSSAVSEDGLQASFAGQFETFLHVSGFENIKQAILQCVSAATDYRVKHYSSNRLAEADLRISVIVQNMVPARVSGVIFTADPVTHRRDKLIINAVEGYGEALVSGKQDAHHYELIRGGSNIEAAIQSDGHLLTLQQMQSLREEAIRAEKATGCPVDMEWVIGSNHELQWVQSRPITTLDPVHYNELDTVKGESSDIWTLGNIGEMMPGVSTPLTYSTVVDGIDYGMCVLGDKAGAIKLKNRLPNQYQYIQMFYNRLFINLTHMMDYARYTWLNKPENIQLSLSVVVDPSIRETEKAPLPLRVYNFCRQTSAVFRANSYLRKLQTLAADYRLNADLPLTDLYRELDEKKFGISLAFGYHLITSGQSGTLYSAFMGILTDDKRLPNARDHHMATILLSDIPDVESANAVKSLETFSHVIRQYPEFTETFIHSSPTDALLLLTCSAPGEIKTLYSAFIQRHGHRCVRESELREKPWEENQERLVQLLQAKVRFGQVNRPGQNTAEEMAQVLKRLPLFKRMAFMLLLPTARKAVARREISKALAIKIVNEYRKGYRALALKMLHLRLLDDADQVYFLTHSEVGRLINTSDRSVLLKANRRRKLLPETDKLMFPEVCHGIPEPIKPPATLVMRENQLQGTPVSSGKIKARVRIIHTLEDADKLEKGEIMVASFTDIGWSPYFSIISGLITEIGSPLSHGAVVAREYGIPAIVSVKEAKSVLRDGDFVLLDGDHGTVERLTLR